ncbi:MAG: hypothetical protein KGS72_00845 [Cyanobacteria bacterium REEB67]|nr:hypothetical protein [Cyanobacteria bacterium REEB67]
MKKRALTGFYLFTLLALVVPALASGRFSFALLCLPLAAIVTFMALAIGTIFNITLLYFSQICGLSCLTVIDENGIRDKLGLICMKYKWSQISNIELKNGSLYFTALVNGIQIPRGAFSNSKEAETILELCQELKMQADKKKTYALPGRETISYVPDPDFVLKSIQAEEEAKWRALEKTHFEQNKAAKDLNAQKED